MMLLVLSTILQFLSIMVAGIQCTPLSGIPMGRIEYGPDMTPNYMLGTTATYICNDGFFLDLSVGNEVRTCEDDNGLDDLGEFTGSQPTCVRKYLRYMHENIIMSLAIAQAVRNRILKLHVWLNLKSLISHNFNQGVVV